MKKSYNFPDSGAEILIGLLDTVDFENRTVPTMKFKRVGDTVEIYVNGTRALLLDRDEWNVVVRRMG